MGVLAKIEEKLGHHPSNESKAHTHAPEDESKIGYAGQSTGSGTGMVGGGTGSHPDAYRSGAQSSQLGTGAQTSQLASGAQTSQQGTGPHVSQLGTGTQSSQQGTGMSSKTAALMAHSHGQTASHNTTPGLPGQFTGGAQSEGSHDLRHPIQSGAGRDFGATDYTSGTGAQYSSGDMTGTAGQHGTGGMTGSSSQYPIGSAVSSTSAENDGRYSTSGTIGQNAAGSSLRHPTQGSTGSQYDGATVGREYGNISGTTGREVDSGGYNTTSASSNPQSFGQNNSRVASATDGYETSRQGHDARSDGSRKVRANVPYDPYSSVGQKAAFDAATSSNSNDSAFPAQPSGTRSSVDEPNVSRSQHGGITNSMHTGPHAAMENKEAIPTAGGQKLGGATGANQGYSTTSGNTTGESYRDESLAGPDRRQDSHLGRDATMAGGAGGAAGVAAHEIGQSRDHHRHHHDDGQSANNSSTSKSGYGSTKDRSYESNRHHHHQDTTELPTRNYGDQAQSSSHHGGGQTSASSNLQDISYMHRPTSGSTSGQQDTSSSSGHRYDSSALGAGALGAGAGAIGGSALSHHYKDDKSRSSGGMTSDLDRDYRGQSQQQQSQYQNRQPNRSHEGIGSHYQAGYEAGYQAGFRDAQSRQ